MVRITCGMMTRRSCTRLPPVPPTNDERVMYIMCSTLRRSDIGALPRQRGGGVFKRLGAASWPRNPHYPRCCASSGAQPSSPYAARGSG